MSGNPVVIITNPSPVCFPSTVDLTELKITAGSTPGLTFTYWTDPAARIPFNTPTVSTADTWYIKGTATDSIFAVQPVTVRVYQTPLANAGPDQVLANLFVTKMDAELIKNYETGAWSIISGSGEFFDLTYPKTDISGLSADKNIFLWTVTNGVCPASRDTVIVIVHDHIISTLITPDMDGKNDYFIIKRSDDQSKMRLVIFDRRGVQVYKNENYDNMWNGIDSNGNPLSGDTYFYVLNTDNSKSLSGYVVIRR